MNRKRPRMLAIAVIAATLLAVTGCGRGGEAGTEQITIGWSMPDITGVYKTATNYFERAIKDAQAAGVNVEMRGQSTSAHSDYSEQMALLENYVSQNVDVIVVAPTDLQQIRPAITNANEAGIPVIVLNQLEKVPGIDVATYIGFSNSDAAKVSAYSILDYFGGPGVLGAGKTVDVEPSTYLDLEWWQKTYEGVDPASIKATGSIIEGIAGTLFSVQRLKGFDEVMSQYPGVEIRGNPIAADWNRSKGVRAAEDFVTRYGTDLDFIWAASNEMGLGAIKALQRKGVLDNSGGDTPPREDKIAVVTNDVTPESVDAARQGTLVAETHHGFPEWGWFGAKFAVQLGCGQQVPEQFDVRPRTMWKGNADQFYPEPAALKKIDWQAILEGCR